MLLKTLAATLLLTISGAAIASERTVEGTSYVSSPDNAYAELCIAALDSRDAVKAKARELNLSRRTVNKVLCNETPIMDFANSTRDIPENWSIATVQ